MPVNISVEPKKLKSFFRQNRNWRSKCQFFYVLGVKGGIDFKVVFGRFVREQRGTRSQSDIARAIGGKTRPASVNEWERGRYLPESKMMLKLFDALGVDGVGAAEGIARAARLIQSEGRPAEPDVSLSPITPITRTPAAPADEPAPVVTVPMFRVAAGTGIAHVDDGGEQADVPVHLVERIPPADRFTLRIVGESMSGDDIHDGDVILVRRTKAYSRAGIFVVYDKKLDEVTLKRVRRRKETVYLKPSNPDMEEFTRPAADIVVIGEYLGIVRRRRAP